MYKSDHHIIFEMTLVTYTVVHPVKKIINLFGETFYMFLKSIRIKTLYITKVSISLIHHYSITEWNKYKGMLLGTWKKKCIFIVGSEIKPVEQMQKKHLNNWTEVRHFQVWLMVFSTGLKE